MKPTQEELVIKYINLIYYFAKQWTNKKEDIDDVVQETYLKAFKSYDAFVFKSENQLKSWLLTICRNIVITSSRNKKQIVQVHEVEELLEDQENNIQQWIDEEIKKEDLQLLDRQFEKLRKEDKAMLRLRFYEELSFKEISTILQISEATAKMRCYRAIQKLKEKFI